MLDFLGKYAKALLLLGLIVIAGIADVLGFGFDLDIQHYVALLLADIGVWAIPNSEPGSSTGE